MTMCHVIRHYDRWSPDDGSLKVVADSVGVEPEALEDLVLADSVFRLSEPRRWLRTLQLSGSYTIVLEGTLDGSHSKPIAPDGKVRFFGCVRWQLALMAT